MKKKINEIIERRINEVKTLYKNADTEAMRNHYASSIIELRDIQSRINKLFKKEN